jgi:hypothetical protein
MVLNILKKEFKVLVLSQASLIEMGGSLNLGMNFYY